MEESSMIGKNVPRLDALEKVTGKAKYSVDLNLPGMLHAKVLRSPFPHARIIHIDTTEAEKATGVKAVITGRDVSEEKIGFIRDRYILARDRVRFLGEAVAAVAADKVEAAEEALELIKVEYEELPGVFDAEEAMKPNPSVVIHPDLHTYALAPNPTPLYRFEPDMPNVYIHRQVLQGDPERAFRDADMVIENRFFMPSAQHAAIEPHNAIAQPEPDGGLTIWISTHQLYLFKLNLCRLLGLPSSKLRVVSLYIGGAFGGKSGLAVPAIAGLLASKSRRPVKFVLNRDEVFLDGNNREAMTLCVKDGIRKDGTLLARQMRLILDAGGYSGTTALVAKNAAFGAIGTYNVPNFKLDSYAVATNNPPTGPHRGFGSTEVVWAIESQMNMIAEKLSMDPMEIRRKNLLREGVVDSLGMVTHSIGAGECLDKISDWLGMVPATPQNEGAWRKGRGIALCNKYTIGGTDSNVFVKVHPDSTLEVRHSANEIGQGCDTVLAQMAANEFATSIDKVKIVSCDTAITPYEEATVSSRITFHAGNALLLACKDAKNQILQIASKKLEAPSDSLEIKDGVVYCQGDKAIRIVDLFSPKGFVPGGGEIMGRGVFSGPRENEDPDTGQGKRPVTYYAHGATAVEVLVNIETGEIKITRIGSCFDMGQPINPKLCEGQMEGGMGMGIGGALSEEIVFDKGLTRNASFCDYKIPSSIDFPTKENVISLIAPVLHSEGPYGAKGLGEGSLLAVAPAIAEAIYNATGVRIRDLPITKEKILKGLNLLRSSS